MDDMMSALFGAMGGGGMGGMGPMGMMMGGGRRGMRRRGEDVGHPLTVTLEQLYNGATVTVQRERTVLCRTCQGSGCTRPGSTAVCRKCRGQGMCIGVRSIGPGFMQQMPMRCDSCSGTGSTIDPRDRCATCNATRTQQVEAPLRVQIQPGMDNKHQIPFLGEGDVEPEVPEPGAVVIILQQQAHARFERVGNDLVVKRKISLADALCGFAFPLEHLDGRVLNLKLAPGKFAKPDMRMCVRGEGMPIFNQRQNSPTGAYGDLVVEFEVEFPERLSAEAQATLKKALPPVPAPPQDYDATEAEVAYVSRANIAEIRAQLARDAADDDDDDDASGGGGGIRCAHQ